ncbi:protein phosphatase 2C domain-containing protein [Streptomyces rugosispiralis]|uniref:Protein phosphatase 2C domain-containing protein n=1 Tax=Streptomyces rugosispiralis TaxID=2967341 RepID=A0ABT1V2A8_9ACTN|nr:protein phosphatase 2C domain-containing protein [Streptomyces rugosispiralis]MCQ8191530.1 protein phosphatase 2C domain-containing protein [Streptomyces rugosispiralis]
MRIELATAPGDRQYPNEDYASVALPASGSGGALVVLDGVTPPEEGDGCVHSVDWFTARLGGSLLELSGSRRDMPLTQCLSEAITRTATAHSSTCDLSHPLTPQATVVTARWNAERIEYLVLSDSVLLIERTHDGVTPVLDDRIDRLRAEGRRLAPLRNAADGFFTAAADPDVSGKAVTGELPRGEVRALAALTDGASRWVERFGEGDWTECFALLRKEGPQALIDRVRAAEHADPDRTAFPRGKTHDDAAVVFVEP